MQDDLPTAPPQDLALGGSRKLVAHSTNTGGSLFLGSLFDLNVRRIGVDLRPALYIDPVKEDWDFDQGPLVLRMSPLLHLKRLALPAMPRLDVAPVAKSFLEHCPAIESLEVPYFGSFINGIGFVIESLGELFPLVSDLTFPVGCSGEYLMRIIEVLPTDHLRSVCCSYVSGLDEERTITALNRHSSALRRIELTQCTHVANAIIETIMTTCSALEVFRVTGREDLGGISLSFAHAIEREWVCTRIRPLQIDLVITPDGKSPKYIADPSKETWTAEDRRHWDDLGQLYTRIGSLVRLEVLYLRSIVSKGWRQGQLMGQQEDDNSLPSGTCFPGLLALEDVSQGQIGYLARLSGLTRLKELRGSFAWTNRDVQARLGEREVEWFVKYLPALRVATFMDVGSSDALRMLKARRPGLMLCD
ncbi:MAG: hypothetical protein JOS17DRAFT_791941 [Linnemannia elongata]|nr:MAG: hypothetical protein JOS17DRAFT_791941 [Linnemannia elongata]